MSWPAFLTNAWHWLLGLDGSSVPTGDAPWSLHGAPPQSGLAAAAFAGGLAALAALVVGLYRREGRDLPWRARWILTSLRLCLLALAAAVFLQPALVQSVTETLPPRLAIVADVSDSMSLRDAYDSQTTAALTAAVGSSPAIADARTASRRELAAQALNRIAEPLGRGRQLSWYAAGGELLSLTEPQELAQATAAPSRTALGEALRDVLSRHAREVLEGVVLVTDGQSNAGEEPLAVAGRAAAQGVPVHVLAVGSVVGPKNVRIADVEASPAVFVRDPIRLAALLEASGLAGRNVTVVLEQRDETGAWQERAQQERTLPEDGRLERVTFDHVSEQPGTLALRIRSVELPGEANLSDNAAGATVRVVRQKIRVLLIGGYPAFEFQFLKNALARDPSLEFSSWLQSAEEGYEQAGQKPLRRLPATAEELSRFDAVILFDPDPDALGSGWSEAFVRFVGDHGGGAVYVAGELHSAAVFDAHASQLEHPWIKTLPVLRDPGLARSAAEVALSARQTWSLELTPQGRDDAVFQFDADPEKNRSLLTSLPGMHWHFQVTRARPGATVLARHGDPRMSNAFGRHVLVATQFYGPGRTVFVGFDSTFRWRYLSESLFDGFWSRLVDRVGRSKALGGRHPFTLTCDQRSYRPGDRVTVRAEYAEQADAAAGTLSGAWEVGAEPPQPLSLTPAPDEPGRYEAHFVVRTPGPHVVRVLPPGDDSGEDGPRPATLHFQVEAAALELDRATLNESLLREIARATGGQYWTLAEAPRIPGLLPPTPVARVREERSELWDAPLLWLTAMLLLVAEWLLRKRSRLA